MPDDVRPLSEPVEGMEGATQVRRIPQNADGTAFVGEVVETAPRWVLEFLDRDGRVVGRTFGTPSDG